MPTAAAAAKDRQSPPLESGPMQQPIRIAPSILSADFSRLGEEIRAIDAAGAVTLDYRPVHLDPLTPESEGGIPLKRIAPKARVY